MLSRKMIIKLMFCVYLFILSVVVLSSEISIPTFKYTEAEVEVGIML